MIQINKNAAGRFSNILFGVANFIDGIVRIGSLGFLHTRLPLEVSRIQVMYFIKKQKRLAEKSV